MDPEGLFFRSGGEFRAVALALVFLCGRICAVFGLGPEVYFMFDPSAAPEAARRSFEKPLCEVARSTDIPGKPVSQRSDFDDCGKFEPTRGPDNRTASV
jgi:hypothetical protein